MIFGRLNRIRQSTPGGWIMPTAPERFVAREHVTTIMGLDLGQTHDYSAAAVLEAYSYDADHYTRNPKFVGPKRDTTIRLVYLRRWEHGTDYGNVIDDVLSYVGLQVAVVEYNGVGRPVIDWMRRRARETEYKGRIIPVLSAPSRARMHYVEEPNGMSVTVPKVDLVSSINMLVQQKRLVMQESPELTHLLEELRSFQIRVTKAANLQFGNEPGVGKHDDLVIALGLACWFANRFGAVKRDPQIYIP